MIIPPKTVLSKTFNAFFESEKSSGILLIICTFVSLSIANSVLEHDYHALWHGIGLPALKQRGSRTMLGNQPGESVSAFVAHASEGNCHNAA